MLRDTIKLISLLALLLVLSGVTSYYRVNKGLYQASFSGLIKQLRSGEEAENKVNISQKPLKIEADISAKAACVYDSFNSKWLYSLNKEEQLPLASLTKLMTAVVAKEEILDSTQIEITKEVLLREGDAGFVLGEKWRLDDLLDAMLVSSSNDAAFAIASAIKSKTLPEESRFVEMMNKKAEKIGLKQTIFFNSTGEDLSRNLAGAYGSCKDIVVLMEYILEHHPTLLEATKHNFVNLNGHKFKNTNEILNEFPLLLAGKTGFTDLAGGNLVLAVEEGFYHPLIIAVLGSTEEGRFEDAKKLYEIFANSR
jgi:D-alanyl-D-alanine carboxypeptidase